MAFSIATFNVLDLFDDAQPFVAGGLDRLQWTAVEQAAATQLYRARLAALAAVLRRLDADVVGFQEIENTRVLDDLRALLPARDGVPYGGYLAPVAASSDGRGIACGVLSRFPILAAHDHVTANLEFPVYVAGDPPPFAARLGTRRGVLEVALSLPDGSPLIVFVVHFKSNLPQALALPDGSAVAFADHVAVAEGWARSAVIRMAEALFVRRLVDQRLDSDANVQLAVVGDFNDLSNSVVVRTVAGDLVNAETLERDVPLDAPLPRRFRGRALFRCARAIPEANRFTIMFRGRVEQIDHVLVSPALWARFVSARILNETLGEDSVALELGGMESDHAPLRAEFR